MERPLTWDDVAARSIESAITRPAIAVEVQRLLQAISSGQVGGITVKEKGQMRFLIYSGPCPDGLDRTIRECLKRFPEYDVSVVRDPNQLIKYGTLFNRKTRNLTGNKP